MAQAKRDQNDVPVGLGISSSDSTTPIMLRVDSVTNYLLVSDTGANVTVTSATWDKIDQNDVHTKYGVSSVDDVTLVPIRTDSNGNLLVSFI